jgi:phi LC3 family holin
MKINWTVRFNNPNWWIRLFLAILTPIGAYFGVTGADFNTWQVVGETFLQAIGNPYLLVLIAFSIYNTVPDPTTAGIGDSLRALTYKKPA